MLCCTPPTKQKVNPFSRISDIRFLYFALHWYISVTYFKWQSIPESWLIQKNFWQKGSIFCFDTDGWHVSIGAMIVINTFILHLFSDCFWTNMSIRKLMDSEEFLDGFIFFIIIASPNSPIYLLLSPLLITAYFAIFPISHISDKIGNPYRAQKLLLSSRFDSGGKCIIASTCHVQEIEHSRLLKDASEPVQFQNHYFRNYTNK